MPARIRRLFFVGLILATAFLLGSLNEARATTLTSRFMILRSEVLQARQLSVGLRERQEFSFTSGSKIIHCRINTLTQGEGFGCEIHLGGKVLILSSIEMDRIDQKLATYAPGDRIFLRGRVQLECSVARSRELDWACRYF